MEGGQKIRKKKGRGRAVCTVTQLPFCQVCVYIYERERQRDIEWVYVCVNLCVFLAGASWLWCSNLELWSTGRQSHTDKQ